jgi:hypothetical protein
MNKNEIDDFVKSFNRYTKELSNSKENAQKYLTKAGIYTDKGNLKRNYVTKCTVQKVI